MQQVSGGCADVGDGDKEETFEGNSLHLIRSLCSDQ